MQGLLSQDIELWGATQVKWYSIESKLRRKEERHRGAKRVLLEEDRWSQIQWQLNHSWTPKIMGARKSVFARAIAIRPKANWR